MIIPMNDDIWVHISSGREFEVIQVCTRGRKLIATMIECRKFDFKRYYVDYETLNSEYKLIYSADLTEQELNDGKMQEMRTDDADV